MLRLTRRLLYSGLLGCFAGSCSAAHADGTPSAGAEAFGVHYDAAVGAALYAARCAQCHDHPAGRTPPKSVIAASSAFEIFEVLNLGIMRPYALGLSGSERLSVAEYVSQDKNEAPMAQLPQAPACAELNGPINLAASAAWNGWGRDAGNSRYQPAPGLPAKDIPRLKLKWAMGVSGNRNGQPVVVDGRLFTNDNASSVYALNAGSGCAYWHFTAEAGTRNTIFLAPLPSGADPGRVAAFFIDTSGLLYALDAVSGALIWRTRIDEQPAHIFTGSVTVYDGVIYAPVSSAEEAFANNDSYECCKFRGALVAVAASSGQILWTRYTTSVAAKPFKKNSNGLQMYGPAGGAIWSAPTVDGKRGLVYVATGNAYTDIPYDGAESIIALSMKSGEIVWKNQLTQQDSFIDGCYGPADQHHANCPTALGGDYDFGASATLATLPGGRQLLIASRKSGQVYALDPDSGGNVVWEQRLSGGGPLGGSEFGHAVDGDKVYVGIVDIYMKEAARPQLSALRLTDGAVLWSNAMSKRTCRWSNAYCNPGVSMAVTAIPGAVFAGRMDGLLTAYSSSAGELLWSFDTAQSFKTVTGLSADGGVLDAAGPVVAAGMVYVHSGYAGRSGRGSVLLAFSVDGK